jgi:peptidoglycan-associated lipoprotein
MPVLDANTGWLRANGSRTVLIEGHCDERGTIAYNLVLGEKRARAAKKYLQDLGVQASQLQITSYGETRPFCKQQNEDCYQQNRRAHFVAK